MKRNIIFLSLLLFISLHAMPQESYPVVKEFEMKSEILGCTKKYCIYLPAGYSDGDSHFPVLYLLHGLTDDNTSWRDRGNMQDIATEVFASGMACEMIVVMPDAGTTFDGYFNCDGWRYEDFFFEEFIPHVENTFRIISDRQHRAIAGLSMGGGGTAGYAIRHSSMFSSAYAMSALMGMVKNSWISNNADNRRSLFIKSVMDNSNIESLMNLTDEQCREVASVRWFIDVGDDDFLFDNNIDFVKALRARRIPYQLRVRDGGHAWSYWQEALRMALPFVSDGFMAR